jgi:hypothetical protein
VECPVIKQLGIRVFAHHFFLLKMGRYKRSQWRWVNVEILAKRLICP